MFLFRGLAIPRLSALFDFVTATNVAFVSFAGLAPFGRFYHFHNGCVIFMVLGLCVLRARSLLRLSTHNPLVPVICAGWGFIAHVVGESELSMIGPLYSFWCFGFGLQVLAFSNRRSSLF